MTLRKTNFLALGTHWSITVDTDSAKAWNEISAAVTERIEQFDRTYSRFRKDSLITQMSKEAGKYPLPAGAYELLQFYKRLYVATDGLVTPLIGQVMADAGYDANYSLSPGALTPPPAWEDVLDYTKKTITIKQPVLLDFGAAGKGYLVDIIGRMLTEFGAMHYAIDASGDILQKGGEPITVGLENPQDTSQVIGTVELHNQSLCASAGNRRKWKGHHHIINPVTLQSADDVLATWVIAKDTMTADGVATALFFVAPERLRAEFDFTFAVLHKDMALTYAKDFPVKLFEAANETN